jgi:hypothetical protein
VAQSHHLEKTKTFGLSGMRIRKGAEREAPGFTVKMARNFVQLPLQ